MDIEEIAHKSPEKIITIKLDLVSEVEKIQINKIIEPFNLPEKTKKQAIALIKSIYKVLVKKDASLIEINPLVINTDNELLALDAKMSFDDNG